MQLETGGATGGLVVETPFFWRARRRDCAYRLICFPHAGAGAGAFADWAAMLPPSVELVAVQLPGRQNRITEAPPQDATRLVAILVQALRPVLNGPFAFFGHSGGAILAFELAKALHARGAARAAHLFLSGQAAPGAAGGAPQLAGLPEERFAAELSALGGFAPEIASDPAVMRDLLVTLRADFRLWESHPLEPGPVLDVPITALGGCDDPRVPVTAVEAWRERTTGPFRSRFLPGGHFYFLDHWAELAGLVGTTLTETP
ncbi:MULTISPECIES: thioesterase II family protein [unclassified Streptomyces]|uniref:thioesterase II family protein n=1 Tax=unclassified Streptomyces TaxID=2593676 RepID=UPI002E28FFAF|nr:alpha/beta fold hydrolase [Streptomyces sp. NBC_00223]